MTRGCSAPTGRLAALLTAALLVAGGCSAGVSPAPSPRQAPPQPAEAQSIAPRATPDPIVPVATPTPSPTQEALGHWEPSGSLGLGRAQPDAILLGDGSVLVVGSAPCLDNVRDDNALTEIWDPTSGTWSAGPSLNKPRAEFAAVPTTGGTALVTGGVNPGGAGRRHESYSSTYVYDPRRGHEGWIRVGLLGAARTLPTAAPLLDGRVLVVGGYYLGGPFAWNPDTSDEHGAGILAAYDSTTAPETVPSGRILADMDPAIEIPALATAEVFDPATRTWSPTGSMRYARVAPEAATLADGRVLVVGTTRSDSGWNYSWPTVDEQARTTAEIYDPVTGRFSSASELPAGDWSPLAARGIVVDWSEVVNPGQLVALADGGALLVGRAARWGHSEPHVSGDNVDTLRFDAVSGRWLVVDRVLRKDFESEAIVEGLSREGAQVARLADGRVLVAGGGAAPTEADLFDPATSAWTSLPSMPAPRVGGAAVALGDGSVLLVGGAMPSNESGCAEGQSGPALPGLATTVRFVPEP